MDDYRAMANPHFTGMPHKPSTNQSGMLLARDSEGKKDFLLKDFHSKKMDFSVAVMVNEELHRSMDVTLDAIPGFFYGAEWGDCALIEERYLLMLCSGVAPLGRWSPGYMIIVDTWEGISRTVAIGSNPARGIGVPSP